MAELGGEPVIGVPHQQSRNRFDIHVPTGQHAISSIAAGLDTEKGRLQEASRWLSSISCT